MRAIVFTFAAAVAALFAVSAAFAQNEDEVVIATGFRPESLNRSLGSNAVIDATLIDARGAEHLESVLDASANVTMTSGSSRARFVQIRGVGDLEQFVDPKHYPSVGLSIDGIDLGGLASAAMLFDVDQIEVLRGPQGTTFGASALAGQVNIRSAEPTTGFDAYLDAGLGDYGTAMLGLAAGGALSDSVAGRIAVQRHSGDGYMENDRLGRDDTNGYEETMIRGKLHWQSGGAAAYDLTAIRFQSENGYDAFSLDNTRTTLSDQPGHDDLSLSALGLAGTWSLASGSTVELDLNLLDSTVDYGFDEDWTYIGLCDGTLCDPVLDFFSNTDRYVREREDRSIDLRWLGEAGSRRAHRFVVGIYAQDRSESLDRQYYGPFSSLYAADRTAVYGQLQSMLSDRLELTLGYRLEQFDDAYSDSFAFASSSDDRFGSSELALAWFVGDGGSVYAMVSTGHKPGGVNTEASSVLPLVQPRFATFLEPRLRFATEQLTNVELGYKTELAGGRLGLRAAVFEMSRDEAQLESWFWDPVNFLWVGLLDNADGDNTGAEIDLDFSVTDAWALRASLGVIETGIDELTTFDLDLDDFVARRGIDQAKAPSWQINVGSEWRFGGDWSLAVDVDAADSHRYGYYHDATIGRKTLVSANLRRVVGDTELMLWARNLLDEEYAVHGLYFGNDPRKGWINERYLQFGEPRLYGVTVRHSF